MEIEHWKVLRLEKYKFGKEVMKKRRPELIQNGTNLLPKCIGTHVKKQIRENERTGVWVNRIRVYFRSSANKTQELYHQKIVKTNRSWENMQRTPKESQNGTKIDAKANQISMPKLIAKKNESTQRSCFYV